LPLLLDQFSTSTATRVPRHEFHAGRFTFDMVEKISRPAIVTTRGIPFDRTNSRPLIFLKPLSSACGNIGTVSALS
jgi:hypothetical protein